MQGITLLSLAKQKKAKTNKQTKNKQTNLKNKGKKTYKQKKTNKKQSKTKQTKTNKHTSKQTNEQITISIATGKVMIYRIGNVCIATGHKLPLVTNTGSCKLLFTCNEIGILETRDNHTI